MATAHRQHPDEPVADPAPIDSGGIDAVYEAREPRTVPLSLAGKWLAWSADRMRIVAAGNTIEAAEAGAAEAGAAEAGEPDPILEPYPGRRVP